MSTHDDDRDAEMTTDWPGTEHGADDGEATTVVPRTPHQGTPPPMSPPPPAPPPAAAPPPPMAPPRAGTWNPQWQNTPGVGPPPGGGGGWMPPVGPGQYPPGYPPPPTASTRGPRWGLLGAGALALVVIAVAATVFVTRGGDSSTPTAAPSSTPTTTASASASAPSTTATSPAAAVVDPTELKGLLASVPEISQLADNATMTPEPPLDAPLSGAIVDPDKCTGAVMPGLDSVYRGSGFTGFAVQVLTDAAGDYKVIQSIASFPSDASAKAFVDQQFAGWQACKYEDFTLTIGSSTQEGTLSTSANVEGTNTILVFPPGAGPGRQCQHAMSPRKNVVVDVRVCANRVGSEGWTLARDIGEKITGQR
jgi:serine/threonine kinase PknH